MKYRTITSDDYEPVRQLLAETGWAHRVSDPKKFRVMLANTSRAIVAVEGARIVGFARALCDEVSNGYISMVAVVADRRREGIGRELISELMRDGDGITWILRAGRGSESFWESVGFTPSGVAMERVRRPANG